MRHQERCWWHELHQLACWYVQPVGVGVCRQAGGSVNSLQQNLGIICVSLLVWGARVGVCRQAGGSVNSLQQDLGDNPCCRFHFTQQWIRTPGRLTQLLDPVFKCAGKWLHTQTPLLLQVDELLGWSRKCREKIEIHKTKLIWRTDFVFF